jgi:hypothetical protein
MPANLDSPLGSLVQLNLRRSFIMSENIAKPWSCVGSAGVVNLPDIGKIVFNKSIAQLGPSRPVVVEQQPAELARGTQTVSAVIRYGVVAVDGVFFPNHPSPQRLEPVLQLRYRDGAGHVLAKLIKVDLNSGVEDTVVQFQSGINNVVSNDFQIGTADPIGWDLDFMNNAFYVEVTLSMVEPLIFLPPAFPPAVSIVQYILVATDSPTSPRKK